MPRFALYLLGPPRLERACPDGDEWQSVRIRRTKVVALLAYLVVTARPHRRDALVTLLSPELDTARAARDCAGAFMSSTACWVPATWSPIERRSVWTSRSILRPLR